MVLSIDSEAYNKKKQGHEKMNALGNVNWPAYLAGGAWGFWIQRQQMQHQTQSGYAAPQFPPTLRGRIMSAIHYFQQDWQGAAISALVASKCLAILDGRFRTTETDHWWIGRSVRVLAWSLFFFFSRPTHQPGFRSLPHILVTAWKVCGLLHYETIKSNLLCIKEIYQQPFRRNFRLAPFDFILPLLIGGIWGAWLHNHQDKRPSQFYPPAPVYEEWFLRKQDKLQNSKLGLIGSVALSAIGLFTMDQMILPFCNFGRSFKGTLLRSFIFGLSIPNTNEKVYKSIPVIVEYHLFILRLTHWIALISLNYDGIEKSFSIQTIMKKPRESIALFSIGASLAGALLYFQKRLQVEEERPANNSPILQNRRIYLLTTIFASGVSLFVLEHIRRNGLIGILNFTDTQSTVEIWGRCLAKKIILNQSLLNKLLIAFYESSLYLSQIDRFAYKNLPDAYSSDKFEDLKQKFQAVFFPHNTPESMIKLWVNNRDQDPYTTGSYFFMRKST